MFRSRFSSTQMEARAVCFPKPEGDRAIKTPEDASRAADRLWAEYARDRDPRTRDAIVHQFAPLAYRIANRCTRRGADSEDLCQVAMMGLVKAVDRFDPATGHRFSTFANPTILGEIRRHLRDHAWNLHVPRGLQELAPRVERAGVQLNRELGRAPHPAEIADVLGVDEEVVRQALGLKLANRLLCLNAPIRSAFDETPALLAETVGREDVEMGNAENRVCLDQVLSRLSGVLRQIIELRYLRELSQREVARRLQLSQMQVSRMEQRALDTLRAYWAQTERAAQSMNPPRQGRSKDGPRGNSHW